jgi:hypothetical protein
MPRRDGFSIRGFDVCRRHSRAFRHGKSCPGCDRDPEPKPIAYTPRISVSMPWESARWLSKNYSHFPTAHGFVMTQECRDSMKVLMDLIALERPVFRRAKAHVSIMVYRPTLADCANFVDRVCDAVKVAIDVDDSFFSCDSDFVDDDPRPRIVVEVTQSA